jgi:hypothetical protein
MIVLNSAKAVSDLFDKRGSNYSDRPDMPMIVDLYVITDALILLPAFYTYIEWAGTGLSRSCVTVPVGRSIAACFTVTSTMGLGNIERYNSRYQKSFLPRC